MFICEKCAKEQGVDSFWIMIAPKSRGNCEWCGEGGVCSDLHHSKIPIKKQVGAANGQEKVEDLTESIATLVKALKKDNSEGSYYYSWQANIAMAFYDECNNWRERNKRENIPAKAFHEISNTAAKNFLNSLIK